MNSIKERYPDAQHDHYSLTTFGFWVYLLTDFIFMACIFATYTVLSKNTYGALSAKDFFSINSATLQTLLLITGSFTAGFAGVFIHKRVKVWVVINFLLTFTMGIIFLYLMSQEFSDVITKGYSWKSSAFLSAYFTLIGMIGVHIVFALLWTIVLIIPLFKREIKSLELRRLTCLRMLWQFISIFWSLIYTFVYVIGVV